MIPAIYTRLHIPENQTSVTFDAKSFEEMCKNQLVSQLVEALKDKIEIREIRDPNNFDKILEASIIAMSNDEYSANYGTMNQRRGISDGTMAVMQNGHWKVLSGISPLYNPFPNSPRPTPKKVEAAPPQKKNAVDYLTERMKRS